MTKIQIHDELMKIWRMRSDDKRKKAIKDLLEAVQDSIVDDCMSMEG